LFNRQTNININEDDRLVVYDMHGLIEQGVPEEVQTVMIMNVMKFWQKQMNDNRRKYPREKDAFAKHITFIIDEFHKLVSDRFPECLQILSAMFRQLRKYHCEAVIATQDIETFTRVTNPDTETELKGILNNSTYKVIMGMDENEISAVNDMLLNNLLTDHERMFLSASKELDPGKFIFIKGARERMEGRVYSADRSDLTTSELMYSDISQINQPLHL
jgi:hypothetical protein